MTRQTRWYRLVLHIGHIGVLIGVVLLWIMLLVVVVPTTDNSGVVPGQDDARQAPGVNIGASLLALSSLAFGALAGLIMELFLLRLYVRGLLGHESIGVLHHMGYSLGLITVPLLWVALYRVTRGVMDLVIAEEAHRGAASVTLEILALLAIITSTTLVVLIEAGVVESYNRALRTLESKTALSE